MIEKTREKISFGLFGIRLAVFFTLFFLMISVINLVTNHYMEDAAMEVLRNTCASNSEVSVFSINYIFQEVYNSATTAEYMPGYKKVISSKWNLDTLKNYADVPGAIRVLSNVATMNEYISNIALYRRDISVVITDHAMYDADEYFSKYHAYDGLSADFWKNYQPPASFSVMQPLTVHKSSDSGLVLPVVKTHAGNVSSKNLYIVDINLNKIKALLDNYCPTKHSVFLVTDDSRENLLFSSSLETGLDAEQLLTTINSQEDIGSEFIFNGNKYTSYISDAEFFFTKIHTILCIPQADLDTLQSNGSSYLLTIKLLTSAFALFLIVLFSRKAYKPLAQLTQALDLTPKNSEKLMHDELRRIQDKFSDMDDTLQQTTKKMKYTASIAREQLLGKLILAKPLSADDYVHLNSFLPSEGVTYAFLLIKPVYHDVFCPTDSPEHVIETIKETARTCFSFIPDIQIFQPEPNRLCVLAFGEDNCTLALRGQAKALLSLLGSYETKLSFFIVCSTPCTSADLLPVLYQEARDTLAQIPLSHTSCVYDASASFDTTNFELPMPVERKLINLIIAGKKKELFDILHKDILNPAKMKPLSAPALQKMFIQLYFLAVQALRESGYVYDQTSYKQFMDFTLRLDTKTTTEINDFLFDFFENIFEHYVSAPLPLSSQLFRDYIDVHYTDDLSLEFLAQKYHTSAQYIARLLKKELGMSFQTYLHQLRIAKSKELLLNTKSSVNDICEQVGYKSRNTFIRSFKLQEGITPGEYRRIWQNTKK